MFRRHGATADRERAEEQSGAGAMATRAWALAETDLDSTAQRSEQTGRRDVRRC